jgi:hypothetical protein
MPISDAASSKESQFPPGWNEERVQRVISHYETQLDAEAVEEDEARFRDTSETTMTVPSELVPAVRRLIGKHRKGS